LSASAERRAAAAPLAFIRATSFHAPNSVGHRGARSPLALPAELRRRGRDDATRQSQHTAEAAVLPAAASAAIHPTAPYA